MVEDEHSLFGQRRDELNREERISSRLLAHQFRKRRRALRLAAKRVRDQLPEVLLASGASVISATLAPAFFTASSFCLSGWAASTSLSRYAPISMKCCRSVRVKTSSRRTS